MGKKSFISLLIVILLMINGVAFATDEDNNEDYIKIYNCADLESIAQNPEGKYVLMNDINMGDYNWNPIEFYGTFDGNNQTIYNLTINETSKKAGISIDGNHKEYETYYAGMFSVVENAVIKDLNLLNVEVNINTDDNCFASGLAGCASNTKILNCALQGRIHLEFSNKMCGVAGIVGFGYGEIKDTTADVSLTIVDTNKEMKCEQFLGGILACGYSDIEGCTVKLDGYASVTGYVHNGGIVGMHHIHTSDRKHVGYVRNSKVDAVITFYEDNTDRRAYCSAYVGEKLNVNLSIYNNSTINYERNELFTYNKILLAHMCDNPEYETVVEPPTCTEIGYSTYTCKTCKYSYIDDYTSPTHTFGKWVIISEPNYNESGLKTQSCSVCGELLAEESIPKLEYVSSIILSQDNIELNYKSDLQLIDNVTPDIAYNKEVIWTSSDASVATVDNDGLIYAAGKGTAIITCSSEDGNAEAQCKVDIGYSFKQWLIIILLFGWIWY